MAGNDGDLERAARRATPGELNVWLHDSRREVRAAAAREQKRRADERRTMGSLTGNIRPIDET